MSRFFCSLHMDEQMSERQAEQSTKMVDRSNSLIPPFLQLLLYELTSKCQRDPVKDMVRQASHQQMVFQLALPLCAFGAPSCCCVSRGSRRSVMSLVLAEIKYSEKSTLIQEHPARGEQHNDILRGESDGSQPSDQKTDDCEPEWISGVCLGITFIVITFNPELNSM